MIENVIITVNVTTLVAVVVLVATLSCAQQINENLASRYSSSSSSSSSSSVPLHVIKHQSSNSPTARWNNNKYDIRKFNDDNDDAGFEQLEFADIDGQLQSTHRAAEKYALEFPRESGNLNLVADRSAKLVAGATKGGKSEKQKGQQQATRAQHTTRVAASNSEWQATQKNRQVSARRRPSIGHRTRKPATTKSGTTNTQMFVKSSGNSVNRVNTKTSFARRQHATKTNKTTNGNNNNNNNVRKTFRRPLKPQTTTSVDNKNSNNNNKPSFRDSSSNNDDDNNLNNENSDKSFKETNNDNTNSIQGSTRTRNEQKNLVCYYGSWAVYRPGAGKFDVENIDPFLCTHIIYGFTGLSFENQIKPLDPWNDLADNYGKGALKRFTGLKRQNPNLKALIAIGGWNEGSIKYSKMAADASARARFVASVVEFLNKYDFDGLDLDWEYPGSRGGDARDKDNFLKLVRELKAAFKPRNYLLTAAVSAGKPTIDAAYNIREISRELDFINLMAYDYHGGWESVTGHNAPLFASPTDIMSSNGNAQLNVNWSVNYWLVNGAPPEKLMLGTGSYGRSFTLDRANEHSIGSAASQKGMAGPYTREPGTIGYNELCAMFKNENRNSWTIEHDKYYAAPYAFKDRFWVGYDDMASLAAKAQLARSLGLGGMMMWSIETDDFTGYCHNEKFPLLNTLKRVMNANSNGGSVTRPPLTPSTTNSDLEIEDDSTTTTTTTATAITTRRPSRRPTRRPTTQPSTTKTPFFTSTQAPPRTTSTLRPTTSTATYTTQTALTSTTSRRPTTTPAQFECRSDGMFADPRDCRKFYRCVSLGAGFTTYTFDCPPGTGFNEAANYCDHLYNVPNCNGKARAQDSDISGFAINSADRDDDYYDEGVAREHDASEDELLLAARKSTQKSLHDAYREAAQLAVKF